MCPASIVLLIAVGFVIVLLLSKSSNNLKGRVVTLELEAKLQAVAPYQNVKIEVEFERYGNQSERLKIAAYQLQDLSGSLVELWIDQRLIATLTLTEGKQYLEATPEQPLGPIAVKSTAEIRLNNAVICSGEFWRD